MITAAEQTVRSGSGMRSALPPNAGAVRAPARASGVSEQQQRKSQALQRLPGLKQSIILASMAAFSVFSLLVGSHQIGSSATASSRLSGSVTQAQSSQSQQPGDSGYFSQNQGGYSFGSGGSSQAPVAGSGTS